MYWPIATPRIYATSSSRNPAFKLFESDDGLPPTPSDEEHAPPSPHNANGSRIAAGDHEASDVLPLPTPVTPQTPGIQPFEFDDDETSSNPATSAYEPNKVPSRDPILALRVSRTGHLFA